MGVFFGTYRWILYVGLGFALVTFVCTACFLMGTGGGFVSPDETANQFFIDHFAATGSFRAGEPLNTVLDNRLHPRSILAAGGNLLPVSFLGLLVLYGAMASMIGSSLAPFLTICLAVAASFAWYGIVRRITHSRSAAYLALFLLVLLPPWMYYTARLLMPNVPFVSFLLLAWWLYLRAQETSRMWLVALSGSCLGMALTIRPSEGVWVLPIVFLAWLVFRKQTSWRTFGIFLGGMSAPLMVLAWYQWQTYGAFWLNGYTFHVPTTPTVGGDVPTASSVPLSFRQRVETYLLPIFPFGIHPRRILQTIYQYGRLFWWITLPCVVAWCWYGKQVWEAYRQRKQWTQAFLFAVGVFLAGAWLFVAYGSWNIHDNPDPTSVTIANSYVRYWLPLYVASTLPLAFLLITWVRALGALWRHGVVGILCAAYAGASLFSVYYQSDDSLVRMRQVLVRAHKTTTEVFALTKKESVIVVDRADKLFFPGRRVIYPLRSDDTYELLPRIAAQVPVYYFGISFPEADIDYLNTIKLPPLGLSIQHIATFGEESLYLFSPQPL